MINICYILNMKIRYIDLFCGIGGFRIATNNSFFKSGIDTECVFSSDNDEYCKMSYEANFGDKPYGDITKIDERDIPDHDILFAGFPCQPFSILGNGKGFEDTRGTLFFDIARIIKEKTPTVFVLENVKMLVGHKQGYTIERIVETLQNDLSYFVDYKVLNALDFGLPQKRERVIIVGSRNPIEFNWPEKQKNGKTLTQILEKDFNKKYIASDYIRNKRKKIHSTSIIPSIWHENKAGNISSHSYSCALRANASHNYLLVNGERRLTPREMLRLQGFPDSYKIVVPDSQIRRQAGNAVPVNVIEAVLDSFMPNILPQFDMIEPFSKMKLFSYNNYAKKKISTFTHGR